MIVNKAQPLLGYKFQARNEITLLIIENKIKTGNTVAVDVDKPGKFTFKVK